jgi:exopolyphosphatase/guanosine-5'-triphosphate,3'-diphosphate pyrophosphatase
MVIARVVDGAMQIIGRLKQRVHLADGLDENSVLSEEAMTRGLNCLSLFAERLQGSPSSVCIVGTHTLRQATNAAEFLKRAEKVIPYPIEIISGNEEARLIFMGVEHTQPERGRKLVIDIGGGSTELVIGEDFEPRLVESRRMGCVSFSQAYFLAGPSIKKTSSARAWRRCRNWKRWPGSSVFRAGPWRWAPPAPLKPPRKCWWRWARRTGLLRRSASKCWSVSC